jgi:hypothetical protein
MSGVYNPCDACDRQYHAGMIDSGTNPCEECRFEIMKKRVAFLEERLQKCQGAYALLGEVLEPQDPDLDTNIWIKVPCVQLLLVSSSALPDLPEDIRSATLRSIRNATDHGRTQVSVWPHALERILDIADNISFVDHDLNKAHLKAKNQLYKILRRNQRAHQPDQ